MVLLILAICLLGSAQFAALSQTRMPQLKFTDRTLANGLRVLSAPGKGTRIVAEVPLPVRGEVV